MMLSFSTTQMDFALRVEQERLHIGQYGHGGHSWIHPNSAASVFAVYAHGQRWDAATLHYGGCTVDESTPGVRHAVMRLSAPGLEIEHHIRVYVDTALIEMWQVIGNRGGEAAQISRIDSFSLNIPAAPYELLYYTSDWGQEFEPVRVPLSGEMILETRFGRSSKGQHPWFALFDESGRILSGSVAWSGNWVFRFEPLPDRGYRLSGGLHDWHFAADLQPGETIESPPVILVLGGDLNRVSQQYTRVGRRYWYPRNALSARLPVEWNPWWSYEDTYINDTVFRQNTAAAADLGVEICVLDAGWFGPDDAGSEWYHYRGDWDQVNTQRFPQGIRALADDVHARGLKFGLWCEIEGLGKQAQVARTRPELAALRDGEPLGYICFGYPAAQAWAYQTLCRLIQDYRCDWIKLDFNLEPGAGCNRADHGHGAGDGLYAHYRGYYRTLERVRQTFPEVVLENCSSGGLRIDLGMLRRTHLTFLSDPDWPVHDLQIFWGTSTLLAPDACLHWSFSEWCSPNPPPQQTFDPRDPQLKPHQLDYYTRIAMLTAWGFSQKLPELPAWVLNRLHDHIRIYQQGVRRFIREADLYRLTDQPRRDGSGDRWCAFQYSLPDRSEHLLFVFRLPGAEPTRSVQLADLQPDRLYQIEGFEGERLAPNTGQMLVEDGITFADLPEEGSALLRIR